MRILVVVSARTQWFFVQNIGQLVYITFPKTYYKNMIRTMCCKWHLTHIYPSKVVLLSLRTSVQVALRLRCWTAEKKVYDLFLPFVKEIIPMNMVLHISDKKKLVTTVVRKVNL